MSYKIENKNSNIRGFGTREREAGECGMKEREEGEISYAEEKRRSQRGEETEIRE
jgi:hypothetical protein